MVRWEPGAGERLRAAALELFAERGFEQTTAADIAAAAGLTERTFFRHFADKREVVFRGQEDFEAAFVSGVAEADDGAPIRTVAFAILRAAAFFDTVRRDDSRLRQRVISATPSLQERELLKMTSLAAAMAEGLRTRGVPEPQATLAAESGVTVFMVSFRQWLEPGEQRSLTEIETVMLDELRAVTSAS